MTKILGILALISMAFGLFFWADARFVKCQEVKEVKKAVDILSTGITRDAKQNRLWALEDRYKTSDPTKVPDQDKKQEMRQLQMDLPVLQKKLDVLEAK